MFKTDSMNQMNAMADELAKMITEETEKSIMSQLNDFISRELIVVEYGPYALIREPAADRIEYRQSVSLRLKDREYIVEIERQIKEAKNALEDISNGLTTDINQVEHLTKHRAWQALQELRPSSIEAGGR